MEDPTPVDPPNFSIFLKVTPVSSLPKKNGKNGSAPPLLISKFPFLTSREKHCVFTILFGFSSVFPNFSKKFPKKMEKRIDALSIRHAIMKLRIKTMKIGGIDGREVLAGEARKKQYQRHKYRQGEQDSISGVLVSVSTGAATEVGEDPLPLQSTSLLDEGGG